MGPGFCDQDPKEAADRKGTKEPLEVKEAKGVLEVPKTSVKTKVPAAQLQLQWFVASLGAKKDCILELQSILQHYE